MDWSYPKICARTLRPNAASRRVMEKLGMLFEENFVYPPEMLENSDPEDRQAVKYSLSRERFLVGHRQIRSYS
jgi:RimJ/RimL family protein N-acetyltransferase